MRLIQKDGSATHQRPEPWSDERDWQKLSPNGLAFSLEPFAMQAKTPAKTTPRGIIIDGQEFVVKPDVPKEKALAAIQAALGSFEPKHEHKIAGCGFMLAEWFDLAK